MNDIEITSGTIIGRNHKEIGKNNQDGYSWTDEEDLTVAVVCDGCSEGKHSEVGAKIVSQMLTTELNNYFLDNPTLENFEKEMEGIRNNILSNLRVLANSMKGSFSRIVHDYFLFTIVGLILTKEKLALFSIGDGVIVLNEEIMEIGPFPNNEPPYIAYSLLDSSLIKTDEKLLKFTIHKIINIKELSSIIISSDGLIDIIKRSESKMPGKNISVGSVNQFVDEDKYYKNKDNIRRKLSLINKDTVRYARDKKGNILNIEKEIGLLPDDTTIIALRKLKGGDEDGCVHRK